MFEPKQLCHALFMWAVAMVVGTEVAKATAGTYYPHCTPITDEIQRAWQRGLISKTQARSLISNCLSAEERGAFDARKPSIR